MMSFLVQKDSLSTIRSLTRIEILLNLWMSSVSVKLSVLKLPAWERVSPFGSLVEVCWEGSVFGERQIFLFACLVYFEVQGLARSKHHERVKGSQQNIFNKSKLILLLFESVFDELTLFCMSYSFGSREIIQS